MRFSLKTILRRYVSKLLLEDQVTRWREMGATIGENVFIGFDAAIDEGFASLLTIEDGAVISGRTLIILHDSAFNNVCGLPIKAGKVTIKQQAYIGVNSVILCGVTIGQQAIVGAGSVVTKDIPAHTVAFGSPAIVHGTVDEFRASFEENMSHPDRYLYWDIPPWRDRREAMSASEILASRERFIGRFVNSQKG